MEPDPITSAPLAIMLHVTHDYSHKCALCMQLLTSKNYLLLHSRPSDASGISWLQQKFQFGTVHFDQHLSSQQVFGTNTLCKAEFAVAQTLLNGVQGHGIRK